MPLDVDNQANAEPVGLDEIELVEDEQEEDEEEESEDESEYYSESE